MTVTAEKVGRDLHLKMEGVDDVFVIRPLPGLAGVQITDAYLRAAGGMSAADMEAAFIMAVDGARENAITGRWEPPPAEERTNYNRVARELSQSEAEEILMPAYLWQTTLGIDGVNAYLEGGGGLQGTLKATGALSRRLGLLARPTSPAASAKD
jgi:hypothetical protein